jgi:hypothetical protein
MNWEWLVSEGLISGDPTYYSSGQAEPDEISHAIETAYKNATDPDVRKRLVDMLWGTGAFEGDKAYWYEDRSEEASSLGNAATGISATPATNNAGQSDYTPDNQQGRFHVLGGNPTIWFNTDTGTYLVVYEVPDSEPPLPVYWEVPDEQTLQSYFGPDITPVADRDVTNAQLLSYGALGQGMSTEMPSTDQDPLSGWAEIYERQASVRPYLLEPEVIGLIMGAALEGRVITQAELESTMWWQTHSETQRDWLIKSEADPVSAQMLTDANRIRVTEDLKNSGVHQPSDSLIDFLTNKFTHGEWNENVLLSQISAISDPASVHGLLPDTEVFLSGIGMPTDRTRGEEDTVRSLLNKWLGPQYGSWSDDQIATKAGDLRNNPDAEMEFIENLKGQRMAMFPTYEDRNLSYQDIAEPWRNFGYAQWGELMDETDPLFTQLLTQNDAIENGKLLTREGLKRGVRKVTTDMQAQTIGATGGAVVRAQ